MKEKVKKVLNRLKSARHEVENWVLARPKVQEAKRYATEKKQILEKSLKKELKKIKKRVAIETKALKKLPEQLPQAAKKLRKLVMDQPTKLFQKLKKKPAKKAKAKVAGSKGTGRKASPRSVGA